MLETQQVQCPFCWEPIDLLIDVSVPEQSYIEDCSVCCNPMTISVQIQNGDIVNLQVVPLE